MTTAANKTCIEQLHQKCYLMGMEWHLMGEMIKFLAVG